MDKQQIGIIGATSFVGECLLDRLAGLDVEITAFSRKPQKISSDRHASKLSWRVLGENAADPSAVPYSVETRAIENWVSLGPIWALPEVFPMLEAYGIRRIVALSSTSRFTKKASRDASEQVLAEHLISGEESLKAWAEKQGVEWAIIQPTMIYGYGKDRNIARIAHFIERFGFFPLLGKATGKRQPVHVEDVVDACCSALFSERALNRSYVVSGKEQLTYRAMVERIFLSMGKSPVLLSLPLGVFQYAVMFLRILPRFKSLTVEMVSRMNQDMVFDHEEAAQDLGFKPRGFLDSKG
ncbi:NAD-dependent epimerase/dehydratase family protein [Methylobacter sp. YRD-M1]|uniref:NAD-dependent epimerase/dehydratase family protein n=1 Tax=Methylobacter sp. YRD-M1 TaxID=2911520 RepID=UPI00227AFB93|nr:NAD-dependent epimerase/dehydratase family protein [Methylobacter sp. YRD-M1]WAK02046.1 NAD-dependent epimerase/dehydratase family protein [Methylobacter sp. YRD-M1]